jgi:GMP synthase-like glutamine amidotransferase
MKKVLIFRHARTEGPGYFATVLDRRGIPWQLVKLDEGEPAPADPSAFAGLAFMGGPMSVNDDLPWIPPVLDLIRAARAADVPMLGHCLGGQLMSKALGGAVTANPVKEIGWGDCVLEAVPEAQHWFGHTSPKFRSFHWHGETFSIPPGGTRVLSSAHCPNQAFALGPHLGLQCHIEMTEDLIRVWCRGGRREIEAAKDSPGVQAPEEIQRDLDARVAALHGVAEAVYDRWFENLKR